MICYDYDLCATCYEAGATTTRHTTEHPMQCILTRSDFGEIFTFCSLSLLIEWLGNIKCVFLFFNFILSVCFLLDLYYGGEALTVEQPQSFTCPYCGKMGFTEMALQEHVTSDHSETSFEVVCVSCFVNSRIKHKSLTKYKTSIPKLSFLVQHA